MKILMVDPWGVNGLDKYIHGLCHALGKQEETKRIVLITNFYYPARGNGVYEIKPWFFRYSQKMKRGKFRKHLRGLEYILAYLRLFLYAQKNKFDVIHVQWFLLYKFDVFFLKFLKRFCQNVVYTAHNARPHGGGGKKLPVLKKIYQLADNIVVHGTSIQEEIIELFSIERGKITIQKHGTKVTNLSKENLPLTPEEKQIINRIAGKEKIFLCLGNMMFSKGVDRLIKIWIDGDFSDCFLIVAGRKKKKYNELIALEKKIKEQGNILYLDRFISPNLHDFFLKTCDLVLIVYRHATVSGVIFSAAEFKKPVLCTDVGSFKDYVIDGETGFLVENEQKSISEKMKIIKDLPPEKIKEMGNKNFELINQECSWDLIAKNLVKRVYQKKSGEVLPKEGDQSG